MRKSPITFAVALLIFGATNASWAQGTWRLRQAPRAGLSLELPVGWKLTEIEVPGGEERQPVVLVRASASGSEPRLSETADLELYVHSLADDTTVTQWVEAEHGAVAAERVGPLREAPVGGVRGLARAVQWAGGEPMSELFLVAGVRALHIAWPGRPGLEAAVQHALDTLSFSDRTGGGDLGNVGEASGLRQTSAPNNIVHPVILAPADVPTRHDYRLVVSKAMMHLQLWYQTQLGGGLTFRVDNTSVSSSTRNEAWFANNPAGADPVWWFWRNSLAEVGDVVGARFRDPQNAWAIWIDADPNCGSLGLGGSSGMAIMPRNDLRGLTQQVLTHQCAGDGRGNVLVCRWVGGAGHELGHAFGLIHPPGCEGGTGPCLDTLMWVGYLKYPSAVLTTDDKAQLAASPFFGVLNVTRPAFSCSKLFAPPQ